MNVTTKEYRRTSLRGLRGGILAVGASVLATLGVALPVRADVPSGTDVGASGGNPYRAIVAHNAFRLTEPLPPPPPPTNPPAPPEQPKVDIKLAGLSEIKGVRYAHLMLPDPDQAGQFRYLMLTDTPEKAKSGRDRDTGGQVIVREIDLKKQTVRAVNGSMEVTLNFEDNGVKVAPAPAAGKPGVPAPNPAARQTASARVVVQPAPGTPPAAAPSEPIIFSRNPNRASGATAPVSATAHDSGMTGVGVSGAMTTATLPARQLRTSVIPETPQQAAANAQAAPVNSQQVIQQQYDHLLRQKQAAEAVGIPFPPIPGMPAEPTPNPQ